jgi:hypothetical protein
MWRIVKYYRRDHPAHRGMAFARRSRDAGASRVGSHQGAAAQRRADAHAPVVHVGIIRPDRLAFVACAVVRFEEKEAVELSFVGGELDPPQGRIRLNPPFPRMRNGPRAVAILHRGRKLWMLLYLFRAHEPRISLAHDSCPNRGHRMRSKGVVGEPKFVGRCRSAVCPSLVPG